MPFEKHDREQLGRVERTVVQTAGSVGTLGAQIGRVLDREAQLAHRQDDLSAQLARVEAKVDQLLARPAPSPDRGGFTFSLGPMRPKKETTMLELTLTDEQKVKVTATPVTATGKPAKLDGAVQFSVASGDVTIEPVDDLSAFIVSGTPGDSEVLVSADADLGAGVVTISDAITVHIQGAQATSLGLVADPPIAK